jgi:hypothetical protein
MQLQFHQSRVGEQVVKHVGLFVAVRGKNNVVYDVFKGLQLSVSQFQGMF